MVDKEASPNLPSSTYNYILPEGSVYRLRYSKLFFET